ncbi:MAG: PEP-CTERM sorting domain-containing protein [Syntrophorhabdales bacterium]
MRSCFVVSCAAVMVLLLLGTGGASSPMDSVVWQTPYDNFSGSSLNTALWTVESSNGTLTTGTGGLTLTPTSLSGSGKNEVTIDATLVINNGAFFAALVPFSITTSGAGSGGLAGFGLSLQSNDYSSDEYSSWFNANNFQRSGSTYNGTFFLSETDANNVTTNFTTTSTSVTQGELGLIYSGGMITTYYNNGTGWQQLGAPDSTAGWTGPLKFELDTTIDNSGSLTAVVQDVQFGNSTAVPEPTTMLLLGCGLFGLGIVGRKIKK